MLCGLLAATLYVTSKFKNCYVCILSYGNFTFKIVQNLHVKMYSYYCQYVECMHTYMYTMYAYLYVHKM